MGGVTVTLATRFVYEGVTIIADEARADTYYVAPPRLHVARNAAGLPSIALLYMGAQASLTLETAWIAIEPLRPQIVGAILRHAGAGPRDPRDLRLLPIPVQSAIARLLLVDAGGETQLAEAAVNPMGSLHATFATMLSSAEAWRLQQSLSDPGADSIVRYDVDTVIRSAARVSWTIPAAATRRLAARSYPDREALVRQVQALSDEGSVTIVVEPADTPGNHSRIIGEELARMLMSRLTAHDPHAAETIELSHTESVAVPLHFAPTCSLKHELANLSPASYVVGIRKEAGPDMSAE